MQLSHTFRNFHFHSNNSTSNQRLFFLRFHISLGLSNIMPDNFPDRRNILLNLHFYIIHMYIMQFFVTMMYTGKISTELIFYVNYLQHTQY